jgi:hypothetical protein
MGKHNSSHLFIMLQQLVLLCALIFAVSAETLCRECGDNGVTFTFDSPKGYFSAHVESCACNSRQKVKSLQDGSVVFQDLPGASFVMNTRTWARKCEQWSEETPCCTF